MEASPARLIAKKRDGGELSDDEIHDLVSGVVDGSLGDAQLGAFLMAVCCNGMTARETAALTLGMRDSGRVLRHEHVDKRKVDKHSTGGVGDKVSLLLAPLVAAAGVAVPMVSGRGLGRVLRHRVRDRMAENLSSWIPRGEDPGPPPERSGRTLS